MPAFISTKRPVVKIVSGSYGTYVVACQVNGCDFVSTGHVVKAAAEERARWHRDQHRSAPSGVQE